MDAPADLLRRWSQPLTPLPAPLPDTPAAAPPRGIRAVAFDIYGTLVQSASGTLGTNRLPDQANHTFTGRLAELGLTPPPLALPAMLEQAIRAEHARLRAKGVEFPEIDIRSIWRSIIPSGWPDGSGRPAGQATLEALAIAWESTANPVWPMPGAPETLQRLREREILLAVVSNAQFFTPLLFDALFGAAPTALGFAPDLCHWSYQHGHAKPGKFLFAQLAAALRVRQLAPAEVLYVGNDLHNDIAPAAALGFQTALFAGDARSLRLHGQPPPPTTITSLTTIADWLAP